MPYNKFGGYTGNKLPLNITTRPPKTIGSLGRAVHNDKGYIEKKEIITEASIISQYKYFLLVVDVWCFDTILTDDRLILQLLKYI